MIRVLEWLLGLERIHLGDDAPLSIRFSTPPAPWIMLFGAVIAVAAVFYFYHREKVPSVWRWTLALLRLATLMTLLLMFSRPMLILRRNHVEASVVAVLLDRSASMALADVIATDVSTPEVPDDVDRNRKDSGGVQSRWSAVVQALTAPQGGLVHPLLEHQRVIVWAFDGSASRLAMLSQGKSIAPLAAELDQVTPTGSQTDIDGALATVLQKSRALRLAGILVFSDGRQTSATSRGGSTAGSDASSVPLHVIAAGSTRPLRDISVTSAWSQPDVFVYDTVVIHVKLLTKGFDSPTPLSLELRDKTTDEILATRSDILPADQTTWRVKLHYRPTIVGRRVLRVVAAPCLGEENHDNNWAEVMIRAHDEKISVLFVEGVPRYEYRYLKNLLLRESTIESSCLLLGATPGFGQEGSLPIRHFPRSIETLSHYDVVILGDVDPHGEWLSPSQATMLVDFVSTEGGGLAFIAGERNMPHRLRRTKLEKLLPIKIAPHFFGQYEDAMVQSYRPKLTVEGREHPIFRLEADRLRNDETTAALPGWYWYATVWGAQPAAMVLAVHPTVQAGNGPLPIAVLGRYGAGRTFYLGSDDLWRWRQYAGERFYENVWLQVIRTLARGRKLGTHRRWRLETDQRQYELGEKVRIELIASDEDETVVSLSPSLLVQNEYNDLVGRVAMRDSAGPPHLYRCDITPEKVGIYSLTLDESSGRFMDHSVTHSVTVIDRDPERTHPEADYDYLKRLAEMSGGTFHEVTDDLSALAERIPDRSVLIPDDVEEPLWDTRLMFLLLLSLVLLEWIIRKGVGLA